MWGLEGQEAGSWGGVGGGGICIETSVATGSDEVLTVRTESVRWRLPSPPFLPVFISLP